MVKKMEDIWAIRIQVSRRRDKGSTTSVWSLSETVKRHECRELKKISTKYRSRAYRECNPDARKKEYQVSKDKLKAYRKDYYEANTGKCLAASKSWSERNPEKRAQAERNWVDANRSKKYAANSARHKRVQEATPKWANTSKLKEVYMNCPNGYQVDHIIPLHGELVSGLHIPENLQCLPAAKNLSKSNSYEIV